MVRKHGQGHKQPGRAGYAVTLLQGAEHQNRPQSSQLEEGGLINIPLQALSVYARLSSLGFVSIAAVRQSVQCVSSHGLSRRDQLHSSTAGPLAVHLVLTPSRLYESSTLQPASTAV